MEFVLDNVVGTANILEYARFINDKNGLERFIYFSTDEVFGPAPNGIDYKEMIDIIQQIHIVLQKLEVKN
jgi:dTDP-glucose 4,6-dehydratase